jgi:peptide/nickel transport system substrate-binding protein
MERIEAPDKYTIRIHLKTSSAVSMMLNLAHQAGFIVSKNAVQQMGDKIRRMPIGTGPFRYQSYSPKGNFTLVANEDYWGGKPILTKVVVIFMPDDSTRELALRKGEVEAISLPAKQEWIDRARKAGFDVNLTAPANTFALYFNPTKKPLDTRTSN